MKKLLNNIYIFYLGVIPSFATYFMIKNVGGDVGILFFLLGLPVFGVYISMVLSYSRFINNTLLLLLVLLDGPAFALISSMNSLDYSSVIVRSFLIENFAIWIAIIVLAIFSGRPTLGQALASIMIGILSVGSLLFATKGFYSDTYEISILILGVLIALFIKFKILHEDRVNEFSDNNFRFFILFFFIWMIVVFGGGFF